MAFGAHASETGCNFFLDNPQAKSPPQTPREGQVLLQAKAGDPGPQESSQLKRSQALVPPPTVPRTACFGLGYALRRDA